MYLNFEYINLRIFALWSALTKVSADSISLESTSISISKGIGWSLVVVGVHLVTPDCATTPLSVGGVISLTQSEVKLVCLVVLF